MKLRYKAKTGRNGERMHFVDCGVMELRLTAEQAQDLYEQMSAEWGAPTGERANYDSERR